MLVNRLEHQSKPYRAPACLPHSHPQDSALHITISQRLPQQHSGAQSSQAMSSASAVVTSSIIASPF